MQRSCSTEVSRTDLPQNLCQPDITSPPSSHDNTAGQNNRFDSGVNVDEVITEHDVIHTRREGRLGVRSIMKMESFDIGFNDKYVAVSDSEKNICPTPDTTPNARKINRVKPKLRGKRRTSKKDDTCDKKAPSEYRATQTTSRKHVRMPSSQIYLCSVCDEGFNTKNLLKKHLRTHQDKDAFQCPICDEMFDSKKLLSSHERTHKRHTCSICDKQLSTKSNLRIHMEAHEGRNLCSSCGRSFGSYGSLQLHQRTHTGDTPYKCSICERGFSQYGNMQRHRRTHSGHGGEKPYKCATCGRFFAEKRSMQRHERAHTGETRHKCAVCGKGFDDTSTLLVHSRIHTGVKPFLCSLCPKACYSFSNLQKHKMTHTGEKPHQCANCGDCFRSKQHLKLHSKKHSDSESYACSVCGESFHSSRCLEEHHSKHKGKPAGHSNQDKTKSHGVHTNKKKRKCRRKLLKPESPVRDLEDHDLHIEQGDGTSRKLNSSEGNSSDTSVDNKKKTDRSTIPEEEEVVDQNVVEKCSQEQATISDQGSTDCSIHGQEEHLNIDTTNKESSAVVSTFDIPSSRFVKTPGSPENDVEQNDSNREWLRPDPLRETQSVEPTWGAWSDTGDCPSDSDSDTFQTTLDIMDKCPERKLHCNISTKNSTLQEFGSSNTDPKTEEDLPLPPVFAEQRSAAMLLGSVSAIADYSDCDSSDVEDIKSPIAVLLDRLNAESDGETDSGLERGKAGQSSNTGQRSNGRALHKHRDVNAPGDQITSVQHQVRVEVHRAGDVEEESPKDDNKTDDNRPDEGMSTSIVGARAVLGTVSGFAAHSVGSVSDIMEVSDRDDVAASDSEGAAIDAIDELVAQYSSDEGPQVSKNSKPRGVETRRHKSPKRRSPRTKVSHGSTSDKVPSKARHRREKHEGRVARICTTCGKSYSTGAALQLHALTHSGETPHTCTICGRGFTQYGNMQRHIKRHHGEKDHECSTCGKCFSEKRILLRHQKMHDAVLKHRCSVCDKSFGDQSSLHTHSRSHTGEKPVKCHICQLSFSMRSNLNRHIATQHDNVKPHQCNICGKCFGMKGYLQRHIGAHNGERPFVCSTCGKGYSDKRHLRKHQKLHDA